MDFVRLIPGDKEGIKEMSSMASSIVREHYDPIIGKESNIGFLAYYPREGALYLSKFYLYKDMRGKGFSRIMLDF